MGAGATPSAVRPRRLAGARRADGDFALAAWDWRYYAEKLRKARCDIDEAEIAPYFSLDNIIAAAL